MNATRIFYRTRQFWRAIWEKPAHSDLLEVSRMLNRPQMDLFASLQPGEQVHSIQVFRKLQECGETHPDLMVAALLHDAGKSLYRLSVWERVWIVVAKALAPQWVKKWGLVAPDEPARIDQTPLWQRPFLVAEKHPAWGALLAARAGATPRAIALIRRHQEILPPGNGSLEAHFLQILQSVDDES